MIAHRHLDVDRQLARPVYGPLEQGNFARYFRFEDQLNDAAEWLGLNRNTLRKKLLDHKLIK